MSPAGLVGGLGRCYFEIFQQPVVGLQFQKGNAWGGEMGLRTLSPSAKVLKYLSVVTFGSSINYTVAQAADVC